MRFISFAWRDFKKNKINSIFGIGGITISIFLLSTVGILIDSLSFSYLDAATNQAGSADIMFSKNITPDTSLDLYMDQDYIENTLNIEEIDYYFPRILMTVQVESEWSEDPKLLLFYGINTTLEQNSGKMGDLYLVNNITFEETDQIFQGPIPEGYCILLRNTAKILNVTAGDWVLLTYTDRVVNLTVYAVCTQHLRFSIAETTLVIVELPQAQEFLNEPSKVNYVMATLKNRELIYDTRDISKTTKILRDVGTKIQQQLGFDYLITLPKLQELEISEFMNVAMETMMIFMTILCLLITSILINSILTTSIEERIREFGVLRVLGSHKRHNILIVLYQGLFMGFIGSLIGILLSIFVVPPLLTLIFNYFDLWTNPIPFIILPQTVIQSFLLGIISTLVISLLPALNAGKVNISKAIDPFRRSEEEEYKLKQMGSAKTRIILIGMAISSIGILLFILFPRIMALRDMESMILLFMILMLAILFGFVLAFIGFIPPIQFVLLQLFRPLIRRFVPIVHLSLKRNRRRNTGNIVMFSLTFSFIFFISSFIIMRHQIVVTSLEFQYGSDLVMINQGTYEQGNAIDFELFNKIQNLEGVKNAAPVVHNTIDATEILSIAFSVTEGGMSDFTDLGSMFMGIFTNDKIDTYIGDIAAFHMVECGFIGINQSYVELANKDLMMWDTETGSNAEDAFNALFDPNRNDTIIIAKSIADYLGVTKIGQKVRMVFADDNQNMYSGNATTMTVVGITGGMPGFWNFRSSGYSAYMGAGVMVSLRNYIAWMGENITLKGGEPNQQPIDKIFINLESATQSDIDDAKSLINELFGDDYEFIVDDNISKINIMTEGDETIELILEIVLYLTIFIAIFGLLSTMYSTLLERMYEIGLLRSMGLRILNARLMFIVESLILMFASGILGMFVGSFIAYEMISNAAIMMEMPLSFTLDVETLFRTFSLSITVCIVGVILITRKIKQWSIMDIFRQTF
ncbi:MAG: ABC transporter permease [Promethearchaeota archaeon]